MYFDFNRDREGFIPASTARHFVKSIFPVFAQNADIILATPWESNDVDAFANDTVGDV